jgi:acetyltransferase
VSVRNLEALFAPRTVAVVGASDRAGSVGALVMRNLRLGGFQGPVWPINARHSTVAGQQAWPDVESLPGVPDLAVVCTPAPTVPEVVAALGRKGTRAAIVVSAGLQQAVGAGAGSIQQAMLDAARPYLLRIVGPNCIGVLVPGVSLNASFAPGNALPGKLAFVTQSGALATAMLDWASSRGIGFSHFISLGDSADVDFGDVLDYLGSDPDTRAILMYVESVKFARKFMSAARAAARNKPVILVKAGRAPEGAKAAASHTGAMAGSDAVFDAAVRRAGMLRVDTLEALFDAVETLAHAQRWCGERLAVLTNGGGAGVLAADALSLGGGKLAELSAGSVQLLGQCLPVTWSHGNPVDIVGDAPVQRYQDALRVLLAAPEVDGVLFMHAPTAIVPADDIAQACLTLLGQAVKPVLACWLGANAVQAARARFSAAGISCYETPERAAAAWLQMANYRRNQEALRQLPDVGPQDVEPDREGAQALLDQALSDGREWLDQAQSLTLLKAYGIPVVPSVNANEVEDAVRQARLIGYPVALKILSPQILHKSDVGGVELHIASDADLRSAVARMRQTVGRLQPDARILGYTVQAMANRPGAHELILGIAADPVFGPVVLFGEGGTAVELRRDHAVALPPLNGMLARELLAHTRIAPLLAGYRGHAPVDEQALIGAVLRVSQMAVDLPALAELDVNPLLADAQGVLAVDARIRVRKPGNTERSRLAIQPCPAGLEERIRVAGRDLLVRPIRPDDGQRLADFYAQTSPADMRLRFFMVRREIPHSELARYCQIDYDREMTFIALEAHDESAAGPIMVGEVRAACDPDNLRAEFAIHVASGWQGRGLGAVLLDKLVCYLRERGTVEVVGECLLENLGMAALARHAGFTVRVSPARGTTSMTLRLAT